MATSSKQLVYVEIGKKRAFAGAIDWPGWCRSGRNEHEALEALVEFAPRYRDALRARRITFVAPKSAKSLKIAERLTGDSTTDFGAPSIAPAADLRPWNAKERKHQTSILEASWAAFDKMSDSAAATGKHLEKGPRGGGRELGAIIDHVRDADLSYLGKLGAQLKGGRSDMKTVRASILETLAEVPQDQSERRGPRGGLLWSPRYFIRRSAWHALDHMGEIEGRLP